MILFYVVAAFVFFMWWVRGHFIPAAFLAFCCGCITLLGVVVGYNERTPMTQVLSSGPMPLVWIVAIVAFAPWYIRQQIERRRAEVQDRALNGIRFNED